jgi:RNA polymerase sigma-70 factor (ECF subfamily)
LWLRLEVGQKLVDLHRFHLGTQMRDAGQEVSLHRGALPQVTSLSLAELLLGKLTTASQAAMRAELAAVQGGTLVVF